MNKDERCFLFDIDGTLVNLRAIWEQTYTDLYQKVYGFRLTESELKSMFGPPELEGHAQILQGRGVYTPERAQKLVDGTEKKMVSLLATKNISDAVLPGVIGCLEYVVSLGSAVGVVTGNIPPIAESILRCARLRQYFEVVGCSLPDTKGRYEIVQGAVSAFNRQGKYFDSRRIYVIGDTPSDIKATKHCGYVSVAVATGHYSFEELRQEKPDVLLQNLNMFQRAFFPVRV